MRALLTGATQGIGKATTYRLCPVRPPGVNGLYFDEDSPAQPHPEALEIANQDRLMQVTARDLDAAGRRNSAAMTRTTGGVGAWQ